MSSKAPKEGTVTVVLTNREYSVTFPYSAAAGKGGYLLQTILYDLLDALYLKGHLRNGDSGFISSGILSVNFTILNGIITKSQAAITDAAAQEFVRNPYQ